MRIASAFVLALHQARILKLKGLFQLVAHVPAKRKESVHLGKNFHDRRGNALQVGGAPTLLRAPDFSEQRPALVQRVDGKLVPHGVAIKLLLRLDLAVYGRSQSRRAEAVE